MIAHILSALRADATVVMTRTDYPDLRASVIRLSYQVDDGDIVWSSTPVKDGDTLVRDIVRAAREHRVSLVVP